jgi:hypothetical protein
MTTKVSYCTVKFVVGSIPTSIALTNEAKEVIAKERGVAKKKIRGSYSILSAKSHELLQEGAELKRILVSIRKAYTIPKYAVSTAANSKSLAEKLDGEYLIEATRVDSFLEHFEIARKNYLNWGNRLCKEENYATIREIDETDLADDWKIVQSKYPSAEKLKSSIRCSIPEIIPFDVNFELKDVAPETAAKIKEQIEAQLAASAAGAIAELQQELLEMVGNVVKSCGKRIRLLPAPTHERANLRQAEVQEVITSKESADVPEGMLLITVQGVNTKSNDKFVNIGTPENILLTEAEYKALNPYETNEYRKLSASCFNNIMELTDRIEKVKNMLGDNEETKDLNDLATKISTLLASSGKSADSIATELRSSTMARNTIKSAFKEFETTIKGQLETKLQKPLTAKRRIKIDKETKD